MKCLLLYFSFFIFHFSFLFGQPVIKFDKTTRHLGFVRQGDTVKFEYSFSNTGNQPLVIEDTKVECNCTEVDKPNALILPGKSGVIKVMFKTKDAIDRQDRTVEVSSNASNSEVVLRFKCVVLKAKNK